MSNSRELVKSRGKIYKTIKIVNVKYFTITNCGKVK